MDDKYYIEIDGKLKAIKISFFNEFLNLEQSEYEKVLLGISYQGIFLSEFVYALLNFYQETIDKRSKLEQKRYLELSSMHYIDCEAINQYQTIVDPYLGNYEINKELEAELDLLMQKGSNPLQKFVLIYKKVCQKFSYDEKYYLNEEETVKKHQNITYLKEITFQKKIVCYELIAILAYYLKKLGFNYTVINGEEYGQHSLIKFRFEEYLLKVEPIDTVFHDDLTNVKIGLPLIGLTCINKNMETRDRFKTLLSFYYQEEKKDYYAGMLPANKIETNVNLPWEIKDTLRLVDLAILKVKEANLEVMEKMCYLAYLLTRYRFNSKLTTFLNEFIQDKTSPYGFSALIILSDPLYGTYYVLYNFQDIKVLTQEETQKLFLKNVFSDIREKRKIYGINH